MIKSRRCVCVCVSKRQGKRAKMVVVEKESEDGQHDLLEDDVMQCSGKAWKVAVTTVSNVIARSITISLQQVIYKIIYRESELMLKVYQREINSCGDTILAFLSLTFTFRALSRHYKATYNKCITRKKPWNITVDRVKKTKLETIVTSSWRL